MKQWKKIRECVEMEWNKNWISAWINSSSFGWRLPLECDDEGALFALQMVRRSMLNACEVEENHKRPSKGQLGPFT